MHDRVRDRRTRHTFWIDDRVVDEFGPVMGRYPFGAVALAVYAVLARRADRDGESWPGLGLIAQEAGSSQRTVQRALRLLELLGLVEIASCYEAGSNRQTSNLYTLLTPPDRPPAIDPDPANWPPPQRRTYLVKGPNRAQAIAAARLEQQTLTVSGDLARNPRWAGLIPLDAPADVSPDDPTPRQPDTPSPATLTPPRCQPDTLPPVSLTPQEGNPYEGNTGKDGVHTFAITESGLTNRQVWAMALAELADRGALAAGEIDTWLRPAALIARRGDTLVVGAPTAVARDRIANRLMTPLAAALAATVSAPVAVDVVVAH